MYHIIQSSVEFVSACSTQSEISLAHIQKFSGETSGYPHVAAFLHSTGFAVPTIVSMGQASRNVTDHLKQEANFNYLLSVVIVVCIYSDEMAKDNTRNDFGNEK